MTHAKYIGLITRPEALGSASRNNKQRLWWRNPRMRILLAIAAAATLGLAACSQAETDQAGADAEQAASDTGAALEDAGAAVGDAAHETGEAVEGAVNDAATEVEHATDDNPATN